MINTVTRYTYKAFGLKIHSEIHLPELSNLGEEQKGIDIRIEISDLMKQWNEFNLKGKFVVANERVLFKVTETGLFCVEEGKRVIISPFAGADMDKIRLYVLGTCMGIALMQRRILPLHGSAVAIGGKVYAIVGDSGVGKSTLASAFINEGYELLSDDVIAVSLSDQNVPIVTPSYPQQKLWKESLREFGMESEKYLPLFERENKFAVPVTTSFCKTPLPLAGVFELTKTADKEIEVYPVNSLEKLPLLFHHTYRNFLIKRMNLLDWHFDIIARLAGETDVFRLKRPISRFTPHPLTSSILSIIDKGESR